MPENTSDWWIGLAKELQKDIEIEYKSIQKN